MAFSTATLRSGSSGNATLVVEDDRALLIDVGLNGKALLQSLNAVGLRPEQIAGLLITHEHTDHISGLGVALRRHRFPLYISEAAYRAACPALGRIDESLVHFIEAGRPFSVEDFQVTPVSVPHDAVDPLAFRIEGRTASASLCTDIGSLSSQVLDALAGVDLIYLEANYDDYLLASGPYPALLKKRIRGQRGHLSNDDSARALVEFLQRGTTRMVLVHLSEENNEPQIALTTVQNCLSLIGAKRNQDYQLSAARRFVPSPAFSLRPWHA